MDHERSEAGEPGGTAGFGPLSLAIIRLGRAHRALAGQLMREVGLGPDQAALMMHLWSAGPVRQTALAAHFGKDSASTTRTVQRLERAGFLRRRIDPTDRRATLVEPTAAGHALRARVEGLWEQLERVVERGLGSHDHEAVRRVLAGIADSVTEALVEEPSRSLAEL